MTEQDLMRIERELDIHLPDDYRKAVLNYPIRADRGTSDSWLYDNAEALVKLNREYRNGFSGLPPWPAHYFIVGETDCVPYFMDLTKSPSPVFSADHGDLQALSTEAETLSAWVDAFLKEMRDDGVNPDAERRNNEKLRKTLVVFFYALVVLLLGFFAVVKVGSLLKGRR